MLADQTDANYPGETFDRFEKGDEVTIPADLLDQVLNCDRMANAGVVTQGNPYFGIPVTVAVPVSITPAGRVRTRLVKLSSDYLELVTN